MKICEEHNKPFSEKSPNSKGYFWHVVNFDKGEFHSITKEEYDALPANDEDPKGPVRDYDAENTGKVRTKLLEAHIIKNGLIDLTDKELVTFNRFVELAMTGK